MSEPAGDHFWFLLKDPHWALLCWELSPATIREIKEQRGTTEQDAQLWLRIHDVTDILFDGHNSHWYFDVPVRGKTDHWYLAVPAPNRVYCAELGCKLEDQQFCLALRSNPVFVPRAGPSDWVAEQWANIIL